MIDDEDLGVITPWVPFSDWLLVCVIEYGDLRRNRYGVVDAKSVEKLEWKSKIKFRAERLALIKQPTDDLAKEACILIGDNAQK